MFLVLDDETEQELFRVALSLIAPGPVALPDFNATLSLSEDLIILRPAGREPGYGSRSCRQSAALLWTSLCGR